MGNRNGFQRGSGCFNCSCCGRQTRHTGEQAYGSDLCPNCWEVAGIENEISDGHREDDMDKAEAEIRSLEADATSKGGFLGKFAAYRVMPLEDSKA